MPERTVQAHWEGPIKEESGSIAVESGAVVANYSFGSRFEDGKGTNPEQLAQGAKAHCLVSLALAGTEISLTATLA